MEGLYDLRQPCDVTSLELDDIYTDLVADADGLVRCTLSDQQRGIETTVAFEAAQFPHVVVYTPPAPRQALCIEPYTCPTDGFNLQQRGVESNLIILQPGETRRFNVLITTRPGCAISLVTCGHMRRCSVPCPLVRGEEGVLKPYLEHTGSNQGLHRHHHTKQGHSSC